MGDPNERRTTEVFAEAERARLEAEILRQQGVSAPLTPLEEEEPPTEHVLDRGVMIKWASLTLAIYIIIRLITGPVREAVIDAVREEIQNQAKPTIIVHPQIPPIPEPPKPAEPAAAGEPAPPAQAPAAAGKGPTAPPTKSPTR